VENRDIQNRTDLCHKKSHNLFEKMTSIDHIFISWSHYKRGKHKRKDIQSFERFLEDHIFQLQHDLLTFQY